MSLMNFKPESFNQGDPVPEGWYKLQFGGFKPEFTKAKDGINLQPILIIVQNTEYDGRRVFSGIGTKFTPGIKDLVHACGLQLEKVDGTQDTKIPGIFKGEAEHPDDPSKWDYLGPMTNKVFEAEVCIREYNGKKSNRVKQYKCSVPGCTERHITNLERN